ncbi:unnamed protein product [Rhizoctonia solani]|nr:unnamed protein product [Rhizoctonia solani]
MEDQSYKLANIAGYTSRHYGQSEDWAGCLHKWLPPEFKPRTRRGAPSRPTYDAATRSWGGPRVDWQNQSPGASSESNQIAHSSSHTEPTHDPLKKKARATWTSKLGFWSFPKQGCSNQERPSPKPDGSTIECTKEGTKAEK